MLPALPYTHVIITFNKTKHFITGPENTALSILGNGVLAKLGDSSINTSSIAEVLTIEDFYRAFPDERPEIIKEFEVSDAEAVPLDRQAERHEYAIRGLLAGMHLYAKNHGMPKNTSDFDKAEKSYERLYGKKYEFTSEDEKRAVASLGELDSFGLPKVPCVPCLKDWKHPNYANSSPSSSAEGTVRQW